MTLFYELIMNYKKSTLANSLLIIPFLLVLATVFASNKELANEIVSAKYFWFYAAMGLCALSTVVLFIFNKQFKTRFQITFSDFFLFLFLLCGTFPFLIGSEVVHTKFILFVLLFVLYFYFRLLSSLPKFVGYLLIITLLVAGLFESVLGLQQLYGFIPSNHGLFKLTGSFFNPGPYAGYLAVIMPIAFYYLLSDYNVFSRKFNSRYLLFYIRWIVSAISFVAILLVLPAAMSRAAWLAALVGCGVVYVFYSKPSFLFQKRELQPSTSKKLSKKRALSYALIVVFFVSGLIGMYYMKKNSADGRALIWKISIQNIMENPLGAGVGNFGGSYADAQARYFEKGEFTEQEELVAGGPEYNFNEYLQIAQEFGIHGMVFFLLAIGFAIHKAIKNRKHAALGSLLAMLIFASMSYPFSILVFLIVLVFLVSECQAPTGTEATTAKFQKSNVLTSRLLQLSLLLASLVVVSFSLYNRYPTYRAYKEWNRAKMLYSMNMFENAKESYTDLYPLLDDKVEFLFEYGQILSRTAAYAESNAVFEKAMRISADPMFYYVSARNCQQLKDYHQAEMYLIKSSQIVPNRLYPWYLLTKLYVEVGDMEKARSAAEMVYKKEPKVHSMAIDEMRNEIRMLMKTQNNK